MTANNQDNILELPRISDTEAELSPIATAPTKSKRPNTVTTSFWGNRVLNMGNNAAVRLFEKMGWIDSATYG